MEPGFQGDEVEQVGKSIVIAQSKGGVGKSTTAVNVSLHLKEEGHLVVLIDLGRQLESFDFMLERKEEHPDLPSVLAWTPWKEAGRRDQSSVRVQATRDRIQAFKEKGAIVIVDCPPVDSEDSPMVEAALESADVIVSPFLGGGNDYKAYGRCLTMVHDLKTRGRTPDVLAFMNKFSSLDNDDATMKGFLQGSGVFHYIGEVPRGVEVKRSTAAKKSVWEYRAKSNSAKSMLALCQKIARIVTKSEPAEVQ